MTAPPGFAQTAWVVARNDWRIEARRLDALIAAIVFTLVVLVIFHLALDGLPLDVRGRAFPGLVWSALAFSVVVGMARSFEGERRHAVIDALLASPADRSALFLGKLLANYGRWLLLAAVVTPITSVVFPTRWHGSVGWLLAALAIFGLGLTALATLFAAVLSRLGRGEAFFATLLLPAATPLLMGGIRVTEIAIAGAEAPLVGASAARWLAGGAGFAGFYLFAGLLLFEFVVEE